ncbi:SOS response-associated peptidase [Candidatus Poribacteria bacterium]|nr:SOS response-associated peptidase [Candidatus Poribacteria bacterium]MYI93333.1 SOS response-associated peptidase [Candidatus Poribacteria bacterium]
MCGRFTLASELDALHDTFGESNFWLEFNPRYNITPTQDVAVISNRQHDPDRRQEQKGYGFFQWGLIPSWAKDAKIGSRMINARSETLSEKPSFRAAYKRRRCLVLADGYYEWQKIEGEKIKQPMYIRLESQKPFAFAGLWEEWQATSDREGMGIPLRSCTIITCPPNKTLESIHHRMPVILPQDSYDQWLTPDELTPDVLQPLLKPYTGEEMEAYPVSKYVNRPAHDSPECIKPLSYIQEITEEETLESLF